MTSRILNVLAICLCIVSFSCNKGSQLKISSKNFDDEIELQQNLVFSFNKDVCPDSAQNVWDSSALIEFSPAVRGMFKWSANNELTFSPASGFAPGTTYTGKLSSKLLKHSKRQYTVASEAITFHTASLRVTSQHISWVRAKRGPDAVVVQMDLGFNYDIDVEKAAQKLKMSTDDKEVHIMQYSLGHGKVLSVQFPPVNDIDKVTALKVTIEKGISITGSSYITDKDTTLTIGIPSRYNLEVESMTATHTGTEGVITVATSQPVIETDLKKMITITPTVEFAVTLNEAGFNITSAGFNPTLTYNVTLSQKMEGAYGGKMKSDHAETVSFGKLSPTITFNNTKGMYMSAAGAKNLSLSIVNVPTVELVITKVYENNLENFMRTGKSEDYHYGSSDDERGDYMYYQTDNMGDTIYHKTYETNKLPHQGSAAILKLDFQDKVKSYNGVYVVTVRSNAHYWVQDSKIVSLSDVGLIVKQEKDNMYVFANSIKNATALKGVNISFISTNNQKIYSAATDDDGVVVFKNMSATAAGFTVGMITAKINDEFTFMSLNHTSIGTSRFDVGGREPNDAGLNAMIYGERNLYRPGETIHLGVIVRDEQWHTTPETPVKVKLFMPNGKEFSTVRKVLNDEGSCDAAFYTPPTAMTGTWVANVYTGNDVLLNTYNVSVEEFMPDRIKVNLKLDKKEYNPGDDIKANIQADNLFGTPAADRNYKCELNIEKGHFSVKTLPDYEFNVEKGFSFNTDERSGKTDDKGAGAQTYTLAKTMEDNGLLNGNIMATVFDETGRPVHRYEHFSIYTQQTFIGVQRGAEYVATRAPMKIGIVAVDKNGALKSANVTVTIIKKEWHTVIQQNGSGYRYVSQSEMKVLSTQKLSVSGANSYFTFVPQYSGQYDIEVTEEGKSNPVTRHFYSYGWGDTEYTSFEVNNEGNVEIKPDKEKYEPGDNMNLLFTTPFEGKMVVTVERDHVFKYYFLNTKNKSASLQIKADETHIPNVYITATLIRPMNGDDMPLTVAHGFEPIIVENKSYHLPVKIAAVEKSRSKTRQTISIKTAPDAYVTVAAVDEGILQMKNFQTPNPFDYFYQKVALSVNSYDIYPWLLPEIKTILSSTGGDEAGGKSRVNPIFANRVKLVSFWSGLVQADGSGNLKFDIDIPQFSGDIRVMAVAHKGKAFGNADAHMKVADPIVISTALPRFLSPKDEVVMPVTVTNTTANSTTAVVTLKITGPLAINGETTQTVQIPANKEHRVVFNVAALPNTGVGNVTISVKALGETFTDETEIAVRPAASLQKLTGGGFAEAGNTTVNLTANFIPASVKGKIMIGKSPITQFTKNLTDLVHYPYGCVEQTVSAAFPQLYYADLVKSLTGYTDKEPLPSYNVQQAIYKLQSMQLNDGALSFWPTGGEESWWGSVYATNFLLEARKAGYEVNNNTIDRLMQYMKMKLVKKETLEFFYNGDKKKFVAPEEIPYSLYILAMAGQTQQATMNYYKAHRDMLTLDGRYLLSAAYALSGQPSQAKEILPPAFEGEKANRCLNGSFYSYIRDEAISLNVLLDTDPGNAQIGPMTKHLVDDLKHEPYLSTQENVFSLLALGKVSRMANKTNAVATISANGKDIGTTKGDAITINAGQYVNQPVNIAIKGTGGFYYSWEVSGISADGSYKQEDSYMRVRRTYFSRDGRELGNTFHQNDLIIVRISIVGDHSRNTSIDNVAITDMLPAGFEVENKRLSDMPKIPWIKGESEPDYMDIRDDRVNMFTSVNNRQKDFYYMVRAVSPGTYQLGPIQADAMYDGSYHSYNGAGVVKVVE